MLINGLNITRILIALVLVLLLNSFLYCPRAAHSFSKETRSVKALLLAQSKTSYYKVLLYEHSIYSSNVSFSVRIGSSYNCTSAYFMCTCHRFIDVEACRCLSTVFLIASTPGPLFAWTPL
jgi:hypothetical protein